MACAALLLTAGGLYWLLRSHSGQDQLAAQVERLTAGPNFSLQIEGLRGPLPFSLRVGRLAVADADGVWLEVHDAEITPDFSRLLDGQPALQKVQAELLDWRRFPAGGDAAKTQKSAPDKPLRVPELPAVAVDSLRIKRLQLPAGTLEQVANEAFTVEGRLDLTDAADAPSQLFLTVQPATAAANARLQAQARAMGQDLDVTVTYSESANGPAARLAGVYPPQGFSLTLQGQGQLESWNGTLRAAAREWGTLETAYAADIAGEPSLVLNGTVDMETAPLPELEAAGNTLDFSLDAALQDQTLHVALVRLETGLATAELSGKADLAAQTLDANWSVSVSGVQPLASLIPPDVTRILTEATTPLYMSGTAAGPFTAPRLTAQTELGPVTYAGVQAHAAALDVQASPLKDWSGLDTAATIRLAGISGPAEWALPPQASLDAKADLHWDEAFLARIRSLELAGDRLTVSASGEASEARLDIRGATAIEDASRFTELAGTELKGPVELRWALTGSASPLNLRAGLELLAPQLPGLGPEVAAILGKAPKISADVQLLQSRGAQMLRIHRGRLDAAAGGLEVSGHMDLTSHAIDALWELQLDEMEKAGAGLDLAGSFKAQGSASGGWPGLRLRAQAAADGVRIADEPVADMDLTIDVGPLPGSQRASISVAAHRAGEEVALAANVSWEKDEVSLAGLSLAGAGANLQGDLSIFLDTRTAAGDIQGGVQSLARLHGLLGPLSPAPEDIEGSVQLHLALASQDAVQQADVTLKAENLQAMDMQTRTLLLQLHTENLRQAQSGQASLTVTGFSRKSILLDSVSLQAAGSLEKASGSLSLSGGSGAGAENMALDADFTVQRADGAVRIELPRLEASLAGRTAALAEPAQIEFADGFLQTSLAAESGFGQATLQGTLQGEEVLANLSVAGFDMQIINQFAPTTLDGTMTAEASLTGTLSDPQLELQASVDGLRPAGPREAGSPAANLKLQTRLKNGLLETRLAVDGLAQEQGTAFVVLPVRFSLAPFAFALKRKDELTAQANLALDLDLLPALMPMENHIIKGVFHIDAAATGSMAEPKLTGSVRLQDGRYENLSLGLLLDAIQLEGNMQTTGLSLTTVYATDSAGGEIKGAGEFSWTGMTYSADLGLNTMQLLSRDEARAVFSGVVAVRGGADQADIACDLRLNRAEVHLEPLLGASGPADKVINAMDKVQVLNAAAAKETAAPAPPFTLLLDISITADDQLFVRGLGVDSEWMGAVNVKGAAPQLRVTGKMQPVRGRVDLLGRRFLLQPESAIHLDGAQPPNPMLDLRASAKTDNITATVVVSGRAASPSVRFESTPMLPRDEILAYVLFGRSMDKITPLQAVQLAQLAATFSGDSGSGLDILRTSRSALGLDMLDVSSAGGNSDSVAVGAGAYVSDDVYVGVERDLSTGKNSVGVEVDLTPNISVESDVSNQGGQGVGVNWKWDY